jgi:hypothetical protein
MLSQGYDISFLVTNTHIEEMQKHKLVDFIVRFMEVRLAHTFAVRRAQACHFPQRAGLTAEVEVVLPILCLLADPQAAGSILRFPAIGNNLVSASSKVVLSRGRDGRARAKVRAGQFFASLSKRAHQLYASHTPVFVSHSPTCKKAPLCGRQRDCRFSILVGA